jgi:CHAT domain-containing protein
MEAMYSALRGGLTKSAALRQAQIAARAADSGAHPAYWGAFQLYGSPDALSRMGFAGDSSPEVGY